MKTLIVFGLLLFISLASLAQDRGIGIRVGAPMAITYKIYLPQSRAVEFGLGALSNGWYDNYYKKSFASYHKFNRYSYLSHRVRSAIYLQSRYLLQNEIEIEGMMGRLDWYWGLGALVKFANVDYRYRDEAGNTLSRSSADFDFGPEGIVGMEYTFEDIPLTIFGEFSLMIEILDRPGILRGLSGVGVRYNF